MKKIALFIAALLFSATAFAAPAFKGEHLTKHAKLPMDEASVIAVKAYPGEITEKSLKKFHRGSGLAYIFKIKSDGPRTQWVTLDANTGKVLKYRVAEYKGK